MDNKDTLQQIATATLQEPVILDVDIKATNTIHGLLQRWGILPKQRTLTIYPIVLGNLIRISKELVSIDMTIYDLKNLLESNYQAIARYGDTVAKIVAIAIHNQKSEPSKQLVNFILYNFTAEELLGCLNLVAKQMNVTSFMSSIISVKGFSVLESAMKQSEVSRETQEEIIAPGALSEELRNISALV